MDNDQCSDFLPKEIVAEILIRLPPAPLFKFNCVSQQWRSIISDPKFADQYYYTMRRSRSSPKSSLHVWRAHSPLSIPLIVLYHMKQEKIDRAQLPPMFDSCIGPFYPKSKEIILGSSNGLILSTACCNRYPTTELELMNLGLRVSNPLTKQNVLLPVLRDDQQLMCSETNGPFRCYAFAFATRLGHYKVVLIQRAMASVKIFCSEAGSWSDRKLISCPEEVFEGSFPKGFAYKGIVHWLNRGSSSIVTYDPFDSPDRFGHIQLPKESSGKFGMVLTHSCQQDSLKYAEMEMLSDTDHCRLRVWRLVDYDKGGWIREEPPLHMQRQVAVRDCPNSYTFVCYYFSKKNRGSAEEEDPSEIMAVTWPAFTGFNFPVVFCPWSSPFYTLAS